MGKKLTVKEAKLVKAKAEGKTHVEAYREAYNTNANENTANVETYKTLKKPHVKEALDRALARHDITLDRALAPISKGLSATKQNEYTGEITEDINTQLKASDRALKLMGVQSNSEGGDVHYHLHQAEQREKYDL